MVDYNLLKTIVDGQFKLGNSAIVERDDLLNDIYLLLADLDEELSERQIKDLVKKKYFNYFEIYDIEDKKSFDKFDNCSGGIKEGVTLVKDPNTSIYNYFEKILWGKEVVCVKCKNKECYPSQNNSRSYKCRNCGESFSFTKNTNLEGASSKQLKNLKVVLNLMEKGVICKRKIQDETNLSCDTISKAYIRSLPTIINSEKIIKPIIEKSNSVIKITENNHILYEHQRDCVEKTLTYFKTHDRGQIIHPCGTGKTRTIAEILKSLNYDTVCVVVPSLSLLYQHFDYFKHFLPEYNIVTTKENLDDTSCTRRISKNYKFLSKIKNNKLLVLTTIKSYAMYHNTLENSFFDLSVFDEAHRLSGRYSKLSTCLLNSKSYIKGLFVTATQKIFDIKDGLSMDSPEFGDVIHNYPLNKAIEDNIILDYRVICIESKKEVLNSYLDKLDKVFVDNSLKIPVKLRVISSALSLFKAIKNKKLRKIISYHSTIEESIYFTEIVKYLKDEFKINLDCFNIHSFINSSKQILERANFENSPFALIASVNCFQEGINIEEVDAVLFSYPKKSKIAIAQSIGRCIRKNKNASVGSVIIPYSKSNFHSVIEVVNCLKSIDNRFTLDCPEWKQNIDKVLEFVYEDADNPKIIDTHFIYKHLSVKDRKSGFLKYEDCKIKVENLKIKSVHQYRLYRTFEMPRDPKKYYKEWVSWDSFLNLSKKISYSKEARSPKKITHKSKNLNKIVKNNKRTRLTKIKEVSRSFKKNNTDKILSYNEAISYILKINSESDVKVLSAVEYRDWSKGGTILGEFPEFLHTQPQNFYENFSWNEYLGNDKRQNKHREFLSYGECKEWVLKENIKSQTEYIKFSNKPLDIPSCPKQFYKKRGEWVSWEDFFSKPSNPDKLSYEQAKDYVHKFNIANEGVISSYTMYRCWFSGKIEKLEKFPKFLYTKPDREFKNFNWENFLGEFFKGRKNSKFLNFQEFLEFLRGKGINTFSDYPETSKLPSNVPPLGSLYKIYKDEWKGFRYYNKYQK